MAWEDELARVDRVPDFFLVGAPKCGTTTVHAVLAHHPGVFVPELKEPHFFSDIVVGRDRRYLFRPLTDGRKYGRLFAAATPTQKVGDFSTSYFYNGAAPDRIKSARPDARIIIGLRDPIQRALSAYLMVRRNTGSTHGFDEVVERVLSEGKGPDPSYVQRGRFAEPLARYYSLFGREQVFVYTTADLQSRPETTWPALCRHIGVDPEQLPTGATETSANVHREPTSHFAKWVAGNGRLRRASQFVLPYRIRRRMLESMMRPAPKPQIPDDLRRRLAAYYEDDVAAVERLVGRPLPELRASFPED